MKIYFVRHGESEANLLGEFSNRGIKHGLTPKGRRQATALAESLERFSVDLIYSSPLLRASQTAEIVAARLGLAYSVTDALREYDCGVLEGKSDAASWQLYYALLDDWLERSRWERRIDGGESFTDMQSRFVPLIDQLMHRHHANDTRIMLIAHGGLYRCMLPLVLRNITFAFTRSHPIDNTSYILAESHGATLVCREWCGQALDAPSE